MFENGLSIFGAGSDQYQGLVPGYFNEISRCTLIASSEGEVLISHVVGLRPLVLHRSTSRGCRSSPLPAHHAQCPNASDFVVISDTRVLTPAGNATVCGETLQYWQAKVPGALKNTTAAAIPASLTAEAIVEMARATLAGQ